MYSYEIIYTNIIRTNSANEFVEVGDFWFFVLHIVRVKFFGREHIFKKAGLSNHL